MHINLLILQEYKNMSFRFFVLFYEIIQFKKNIKNEGVHDFIELCSSRDLMLQNEFFRQKKPQNGGHLKKRKTIFEVRKSGEH